MAGMLDLPKGTKLKIAVDITGRDASPEFKLISTFFKPLDDASFLVSVPMEDGYPLQLDETKKLLICYVQGEQEMIVSGYADYLVKDGIRRYWKIRRVSEFRQFFRRADERIKIALRIDYTSDAWALSPDGTTEKRDGVTLDISAGGAALCISHQFNVGDFLEMTLPRVGLTPEGKPISGVVANVCWHREAPKGSMYRNIFGVQFRFSDPSEREQMKQYVSAVKQKYKL